jgi:hypothetical protein
MVRDTKFKKDFGVMINSFSNLTVVKIPAAVQRCYPATCEQCVQAHYSPVSIQINTSKVSLGFVFEKHGADVLGSPIQRTHKLKKKNL